MEALNTSEQGWRWSGAAGARAKIVAIKLGRFIAASCVALIMALMPFAGSQSAFAQGMNSDVGSELGGPAAMTPAPSDANLPAPIPHIMIRQPIEGTMMVSPPYGSAPLRVGFFVLATDPENIGFLTYSWNFGDGTVSSLPPELYIFHTYPNPGTYVCSLQMKTIDGRSKTLFQGVVVKTPGD
jgi:hypothetical protein